jgi:surfeit locus 1 family protein
MRKLLAPRWIAGHLLVVVTVTAFVNFGFWQLRRHDEKSRIKETAEQAAAADPVPIGDLDESGSDYRAVIARGEYDTATEVLVLRSLDGVPGHHVLTPLRMADGRALLVDRGWVPLDYDEPPVAPARPLEGYLEVAGVLWPSETGSIPDKLPPVMKRIDTAVVDAFTAFPLMERYLILAGQVPPAPGDLPVIAEPPELSLGPHLGYAGQWFLFATVVVIGYPLLLRRTVREPG